MTVGEPKSKCLWFVAPDWKCLKSVLHNVSYHKATLFVFALPKNTFRYESPAITVYTKQARKRLMGNCPVRL